MENKSKHLPNRELGVLNSETDFFGRMDKGNAIISFLNSNIDDLNQTNMIALYGKWGSGKSTLMKYIGSELEKGDFKSLYFPAWEFEKDENLPLSLTHFIINETGVSGEKVVNTFLRNASEVLKSIGKGVSLETEFLKFDMEKVIKSEEEYYQNEVKKNESKYTKTRDFKGEFKTIEKNIIKKVGKKKIIIFIDDLDRCEPENVLTLISSIKLFFTYVENVVFMFGCDKDAISKAVHHKYGDIVKADEYLEKVIDISFNMPNDISINKLLNNYFPEYLNSEEAQKTVSEELEDFFKSINFINPRQLKKVLNKFEILKSFGQLDIPQNTLIPKLVINTEQDLMIVEFSLFFIILHEFYNETFFDLFRFSQKKANYTSIYRDTISLYNSQTKVAYSSANTSLHNNCCILNDLNQSFNQITALINSKAGRMQPELAFNYFITIFTPNLFSDKLDGDSGRSFISQFYHENNSKGDIITLKFCEFILRKQNILLTLKSDYKIIDFFRMCEILL